MFSQIICPKHALIFIQGEEWEDYCFRLGSFLSQVLCTQWAGWGSALHPAGLALRRGFLKQSLSLLMTKCSSPGETHITWAHHSQAKEALGPPNRKGEGKCPPGVCDGQGRLACCSPWGRKESDMTEQLNWTELIINLKPIQLVHGKMVRGHEKIKGRRSLTYNYDRVTNFKVFKMWRFTQKVIIEYSKFKNKQRDGALGESW